MGAACLASKTAACYEETATHFSSHALLMHLQPCFVTTDVLHNMSYKLIHAEQ